MKEKPVGGCYEKSRYDELLKKIPNKYIAIIRGTEAEK